MKEEIGFGFAIFFGVVVGFVLNAVFVEEGKITRTKELNLMIYDYKKEEHVLKDSITVNRKQLEYILYGDK